MLIRMTSRYGSGGRLSAAKARFSTTQVDGRIAGFRGSAWCFVGGRGGASDEMMPFLQEGMSSHGRGSSFVCAATVGALESTQRKNQTRIKRGAASLSQIVSTNSYMLA